MPDQMSPQDLNERLALIEGMIAEGRRDTANWAWCFVLSGAAFYVAMAWAAWGGGGVLSWPVTMAAASAITVFLATRKKRNYPSTTFGRSVSSVWIAVGISMFVLLSALGWKGLLEQQIFMGIMSAMLGAANAASSLILKWKAQFACALVWWTTCAACVSGTGKLGTIALVAGIFLCQIVFGIYAMIREAGKHREIVHA
ncbi:MAG TPA: hypothetical protein VKB38_22670 [Terracidiphilus sp.]|nr:hypothetical protein [Terracidiphilus sp.]